MPGREARSRIKDRRRRRSPPASVLDGGLPWPGKMLAVHQWWVPAEIGRIATIVSYVVNPYKGLTKQRLAK